MSVLDRFTESAVKPPTALRRALLWLLASLVGRTVARLAAAFAARRRIKIAIHELRSWDRRWLRDIGLHPMDIARMVRAEHRPHRGEAGGDHDPRRPAAEAGGDAPPAPRTATANDNRAADPAPPSRAADRH